ncbi:MAG: sugar phosphate isomerase/epimerase [Phycisphaerales bacterium]|nr:sugar phosphate isomerase/epimerase [Phycisphaerales bacterium]
MGYNGIEPIPTEDPPMKIAFSNLACPNWSMSELAANASSLGALGVDLRSFAAGDGPALASNPMRMDPAELHRIFAQAGVVPMCLSTGVRFDKPIFPPVIGRVFFNNVEEGVEETKQFVEYAAKAGVPFVRVTGYQLPAGEPRMWGLRRIRERLALAAQTARNTNVRVVIENGGTYAHAEDLLELVESIGLPWLRISYNTLTAVQNGECPVEGIKLLRDHLAIVKVGNTKGDAHTLLGEGEYPMQQAFAAMNEIGFDGWAVYKYPKLWCDELSDDPMSVLSSAIDTMYEWAGTQNECSHSCGCETAKS